MHFKHTHQLTLMAMNLTIFVPNDDAVADILEILSIGQFDIFDLPNFSEILIYHIAEGLYFEDDLYDGLMLTSAQGQD